MAKQARAQKKQEAKADEKLRARTEKIRRQIEAYAAFREAGGTVYVPTAAEKQRFKDASAGLRRWFADNYGPAWLDILDREVAACEARVSREFDASNR